MCFIDFDVTSTWLLLGSTSSEGAAETNIDLGLCFGLGSVAVNSRRIILGLSVVLSVNFEKAFAFALLTVLPGVSTKSSGGDIDLEKASRDVLGHIGSLIGRFIRNSVAYRAPRGRVWTLLGPKSHEFAILICEPTTWLFINEM